MKEMRKKVCALLIAVLCLVQTVPCYAASYGSYLKKVIAPQLGTASVNVRKKTTATTYVPWCKTKGIVSTYTGDLNGDKKKELLVLYLKNSKKPYSDLINKSLCMAIYAKSGGKIVKKDDIALAEGFDSSMAYLSNVFVYSYRGKKYIGFQEMYYFQGMSGKWWIFSVNKKNKLRVKAAAIDPGYTSGVGLYKYPANIKASEIAEDRTYYDQGKELSSSKWNWQFSTPYMKALRKALSKYGAKVSKTKVRTEIGETKATFALMRSAKSRNLLKITAANKFSNGICKYEYNITDYTKTKSNYD